MKLKAARFIDEFVPGAAVPADRYSDEDVKRMLATGLLVDETQPEQKPKPKRTKK